MKTNPFLIVLLFLLLAVVRLNAQVETLAPGQHLPEFKIHELFNSTKKNIVSTAFNDRLLIIDFWATNCGGCVEALPKMQRLQQEFPDKVKVLPVTYEPLSLVTEFWKNNKYTKNLSLTSVVNDKIFSSYFKHKTIPHEVWVYKGEIIGITTSEYVDAHNINDVLSGKKIDWPLKYDFFAYNNGNHLFKLDSRQVDTLTTSIQYKAISGYKDSVNSEGFTGGSGIIKEQHKKSIRVFFLNQPVLNTYRTYLGYLFDEDSLIKPAGAFYSNEIKWEVRNESRYHWLEKFGYSNTWTRQNGICYESVFPDTGQTDKQIYKKIINDLNSLLGLNVRWEKRAENVLVMYRDKAFQTPKVKGTPVLAGTIIYDFNRHADNPYLFSDLDPGQQIFLSQPVMGTDSAGLANSLTGSGYALRAEVRNVHKLVFSEINGSLIKDAIPQALQNELHAQKNMSDPTSAENDSFLRLNKLKPGVRVLSSGLQYKIIQQGSGKMPDADSRIQVNYVGRLVNGKIFDNSYQTGGPAEFNMNAVIQGWKEALLLMPERSKWEIYIPASLAYATHTAQGHVPPNSVLIFQLELLKILTKNE